MLVAVVLVVGSAAVLASCGRGDRAAAQAGGGDPRTSDARAGDTAGVECFRKPLRTTPFPRESGVYRAGPLTLLVGEDLAQLPPRPRGHVAGSKAIAVLRGDRPVVLSVDPASAVRFSVQFAPLYPGSPVARIRDGRSAVRFPDCGPARDAFPGGILFAGSGCARLHVAPARRPVVAMVMPIAGSLRGCPAPTANLPASAAPYLGVACPHANSIACDRVGIGVTLRRPATLVTVRVAGRLVTLTPSATGTPGETLWEGDLEGADLRRGPLAIRLPDGGHVWFGTPAVWARTRTTAFLSDGGAAAREDTVQLHPGYG